MNEQTQQADDPSGPGWRDVEVGEILQPHDMFRDGYNVWAFTENTGVTVREGWERKYRRRIEQPQQQPESETQAITPDDPSGPGWRDVGDRELLQVGDMYWGENEWQPTQHIGVVAYIYGAGYRRRIEQPQSKPEANPDDPSGSGWRWVCQGEKLELHDMMQADGEWWPTKTAGQTCSKEGMYRRRIEPQPQAQPNPDDPRGDGWRDLGLDEPIEQGDVYTPDGYNWLESDSIGRRPIEFPNRLEYPHLRYRRRIEPQQPSDSEPETMDDLRRRLAECEVLLAEYERGGRQANAKLQQLWEQVATLTRERDRYRNQLAGAIEHSKAPEAQAKLVDRLQAWLRPVLEVVADHPDHSSILAASVLEFLPQIASRLIEE